MGNILIAFIATLVALVLILILRLLDDDNMRIIESFRSKEYAKSWSKSIPENILKKNLYKRTRSKSKVCSKIGNTTKEFSLPTWYPKTLPENLDLISGGEYQPCTKIKDDPSTAIIVPYRGRRHHLQVFLPYLHNFLQTNQPNSHYKIFIVEQTDDFKFNRAFLLNIGHLQAKMENYSCIVFHDVDMLPENNFCQYKCENSTGIHLASRQRKWNYKPPSYRYFGGISLQTTEMLNTVNGNPNRYFGWGGEDDILRTRLEKSGFQIKYSGKKQKTNSCRIKLSENLFILFSQKWKAFCDFRIHKFSIS